MERSEGAQEARNLWPHVAHILEIVAECSTPEKSTQRDALARMLAVADYYPNQLDHTLRTAALAVLRKMEFGGSQPVGAQAVLDLVAEAAVQAKCLAPMNALLDMFEDGAPRAKLVRQYCALLLQNMLEIAPASHGKRLEACFLQLAADKAVAVRGFTIPCLASLGTRAAIAALVEMTCSDLVCKVRFEALKALSFLKANHALALEPHLIEMLMERSMDISPRVRCSLFSLFGMTRPFSSPRLCGLLRQGLVDTDANVRRECESMLWSWLAPVAGEESKDHGDHGATSRVLKLIEHFFVALPCQNQQTETLLEAILHRLLERDSLESCGNGDFVYVAEQAVRLLLHGESLDKAQIMLGRVAISMDPRIWNLTDALRGSPLLRKTLEALDSGNTSTLRQLLMVLLNATICDEVAAKTLLQIATATLLRCPLGEASTRQSRANAFAAERVQKVALDPFRLAVLLARQSLQSSASAGRTRQRSNNQVESALAETIQTVLRVLVARAKASFPSAELHSEDCGLSGITKDIAAYGVAVCNLQQRIQELRTKCQQLAGARNYVAAYSLRQEMEHLQKQRKESECKAEDAFAALGSHLARILCVCEAFLSYREADLEDDFADVLRQALMLVDSVPFSIGSTSWPTLHAQAIRCIALHASISLETAVQHRCFFQSVLGRYVPEVLSCAHPHLASAAAAEDIILTSVSFLIDTFFLHDLESWDLCDPETGNHGTHTQDASDEICEHIAPLLAGLAGRRGSCSLHEELASRFCTLLLFRGIQTESPAHCWVAAWLLQSAFAEADLVETSRSLEAAVLSGRLLRFFASLRRLSSCHLEVLAIAARGFLFFDMWQLPGPAVVHSIPSMMLSRVVRFVSRELSSAEGVDAATEWWLHCLWRPLALLCLERAALGVDGDPRILCTLPQALLAALSGTEPSGSNFAFAPEHRRVAMASEVAWVLNRFAELCGCWNRSKSSRKLHREGLPQGLLEQRARLASFCSTCSDPESQDWQAIYTSAATERSRLRHEIEKLGVVAAGLSAIPRGTEGCRTKRQRCGLAVPLESAGLMLTAVRDFQHYAGNGIPANRPAHHTCHRRHRLKDPHDVFVRPAMRLG
eukprot:s180_g25.t1